MTSARVAYSKVVAHETPATAVAWWTRATARFAAHGIRTERLLTDKGARYRSREGHQVSAAPAIAG